MMISRLFADEPDSALGRNSDFVWQVTGIETPLSNEIQKARVKPNSALNLL